MISLCHSISLRLYKIAHFEPTPLCQQSSEKSRPFETSFVEANDMGNPIAGHLACIPSFDPNALANLIYINA